MKLGLSKRIKILLLSGFVAGSYLAQADVFSPKADTWYRIENQFSGMLATGYGKILMNHYTNNDTIRHWRFEPSGTAGVYYVKRQKGEAVYMGAPEAEGQEALLDWDIIDLNIDKYRWKVEKVLLADGRDLGFYTIQSVSTDLYLTHTVNMDLPNLRGLASGPDSMCTIEPYTGNRNQLWMIEPTIANSIEVLSVPQGGWNPEALNKSALLSSDSYLGATVPYSVSGASEPITGSAIYWGPYWNDQHFYVINLNHDALTIPGTYTLNANGRQAEVRIVEQAYTKPYRQHGADRFDIIELFDDEFGFVGQWGHMTNWWPKGLASMPVTEFGWRDWKDNNGNDLEWENFVPSREISEQQGLDAYTGGWDMTDQSYHEWAKDGEILRDLVTFYRNSEDPALQAELVEEIVYGVKGLLVTQESDGSWRQGAVEGSTWLGTCSHLGGGLAAAHEVVAQYDPTLAGQMMNAADQAWDYVYSRKDDKSLWAVPWEAILPDGTLMTNSPQTHRHGYLAEFLEFAVEMVLLNDSNEAQGFVDDVLSRGAMNSSGRLYHTQGNSFPGEQTIRTSVRAVPALIKYFEVASDSQRQVILDMCQTYYDSMILRSNHLNGPVGMFEGAFFGGYTGGQWDMPGRMMISALLYDRFGDGFARGMVAGQRAIDYWTGCNPYATSLMFGIGDEFQVSGWSSQHALGRHVGLLATLGTSKSESSTGSFMSKETTCAGGVQVWLAWQLFEQHLDSIRAVECFDEADYAGNRIALGTGRYSLQQLKAYGLDELEISSIRVPVGMRIKLFDADGFGGSSKVIDTDTNDLAAWDDRVVSLQVESLAPVSRVVAPISGAVAPGGAVELSGYAVDPQEGMLNGSAIVWSSNLDGVIGEGARLSASLSVGTHLITMTATDTEGHSSSSQIELTVELATGTEIAVTGNGQQIADHSTIPDVGNGTDLGAVAVGTYRDVTYQIMNAGSAELVLQPVAVNGAGWSVMSQPSAVVTGGQSTVFTIRFEPSGLGVSAGVVSFENNDSDESPFTFTVSGEGMPDGYFDPTTVGSCVLWLDGNDLDADGVSEGNGEAGISSGSVSVWKDKSGQGNHAEQTVAGNRASLSVDQLNGGAVIRFDGVDDYMTFPELTDIRTVFWVVKEKAGASGTRFMLGHSNSYQFHRGLATPATIWHGGYAHQNIKNGSTYLDGGLVEGTTTLLPQGVPCMLSLVTAGDVEANRLTRDRNNGERSWDGDIAEILIFNEVLSENERLAVEGYLNAKWFNHGPEFVNDLILKPNAVVGEIYVDSISGSASDVDDDAFGYDVVTGPDWLTVSYDGGLSGAPSVAELGTNSWMIRAFDTFGAETQARLEIVVTSEVLTPGEIIWTAAENITGDQDMISTLSVYDSANVGGDAVLVNNVAIEGDNVSIANGNRYSPFLPESTVYSFSQVYSNMLTTARFDGSYIVFTNLTVGAEYTLQIWACDGRSLADGRYTDLNDGQGNTVRLNQHVDGEDGVVLGQFVTGQFTANEDHKVVAVEGNYPLVNAAVLFAGSLTVTGLTYDVWVAENNLSGADAEAGADPDQDGMDNLLEFAFGGDPLDNMDEWRQPSFSITDVTGSNLWEYVYCRRRNAESIGLMYRIKYCTNLVEDIWVDADPVYVTGSGVLDSESEAITNQIPVEDNLRGFLRLEVEY